jgi:hypothetical protein
VWFEPQPVGKSKRRTRAFDQISRKHPDFARIAKRKMLLSAFDPNWELNHFLGLSRDWRVRL